MKRDRFSYIVLIIFIVLFGLRLIHISADPPANLSWSGGLFFDEGALAHNARNKVLFGEWKLDEWNDFYYSPILIYIKWVVFAVFGVGLVQLRIVPIVSSCLALWGLYLALKISLKRSTAILSVFLLGFNYIYLMYNRLGLTEIPLLFFAVLTLYLWQLGLHAKELKYSSCYMFFAGVSCFTVYIFKALLIYFLPVPLVTLVFLWLFSREQSERKRLVILSGCFLVGMIITLVLWLVLFYYPNYEPLHQAGAFVKRLGLPHSIQDFFRNIFHTPFFSLFFRSPVILVLSFSYLLYPIYLVFYKHSELEPLDIFVSLWFLAHIFFFIGYSYRPTRYYVTIIPPMSILAARGIMKIGQVRKIHFPDKGISFWFWGASWLVGWILWVYVFIPLFYKYGAIPYITIPRLNLFTTLLLGILFSLAMIGFMVWWSRKYRGKTFSIPHRIGLSVAVIFLFISTSINGTQFYRWASTPQYVIRDTSRELGSLLEDAFIAGLVTPMLCIENTHRALYVWENFTNYQNTLERYKLTHLFLGEFNDEVRYYRQKFPKLMKRAKLLKSYWIKGSLFHLFSVVEPSINDITIERTRYRTSAPIMVSVKIKNNSHQQARDVEIGWLLRPYLESEPVITAKEQVSLEVLEEKTITISRIVPPGTYDVMATFFSLEQHVYEAENLSSQVGYRHPDTSASEGQARYFGPVPLPVQSDAKGDVQESKPSLETQGYLVYGPYRIYPAGQYDIDFTLKCSDEQGAKEELVAVIDVSTDTGRTILAKKELRKQDFEEVNTYQTFRLSFFLKASQKLEFRVFTHGQANLWADTITVSFISGEWYDSPITVQEN